MDHGPKSVCVCVCCVVSRCVALCCVEGELCVYMLAILVAENGTENTRLRISMRCCIFIAVLHIKACSLTLENEHGQHRLQQQLSHSVYDVFVGGSLRSVGKLYSDIPRF